MREVLLGQHFHGVFFGHGVMRSINHQFMTHDFTTAVLRKGLQVVATLLVMTTLCVPHACKFSMKLMVMVM